MGKRFLGFNRKICSRDLCTQISWNESFIFSMISWLYLVTSNHLGRKCEVSPKDQHQMWEEISLEANFSSILCFSPISLRLLLLYLPHALSWSFSICVSPLSPYFRLTQRLSRLMSHCRPRKYPLGLQDFFGLRHNRSHKSSRILLHSVPTLKNQASHR